MRKAFEQAAERLDAQADVAVSIAYRATRVREKAQVIQYAKRAIQAVGLEPEIDVMLEGTDASIL